MKFTVTFDEYKSAQNLALRRRSTLVFGLYALLLAYVAFGRPWGRESALLLGALVVIFILGRAMRAWTFHRVYHQVRARMTDIECKTHADGYELKTARGTGGVRFEDVVRVTENARVVLVFNSNSTFHVFPKRVEGVAELIDHVRSASSP